MTPPPEDPSPLDPPVAPASALAVESFVILEVQYPRYPGWYYAPQLTLRETTGMARAIVTKLAFTIPGFMSASHNAAKCISPGQTLPLFTESYGDFEFTMDKPGERSPVATASVEITFEDSEHRRGTLSAIGLVTPGTLPPYTGGTSGASAVCTPAGT